MRKLRSHLYDARIWLVVVWLMAAFFIFLAWLAYPDSFAVLVGLMVAFPLLISAIPVLISVRKEASIMQAFRLFINEPDEENEEALYQLLPLTQQPLIRQLAQRLQEKEDALTSQEIQVSDYESYIEEWVHEIKKPLSLLTLVLDNRQEEMTPVVQQRVAHARNEIQSDVEKILYFSRLRTVHRDYFFEPLDIKELCQEALEEHHSILEEASFRVEWSGETQTVISDRKSLLFILSQILHNSAKYAAQPKAALQIQVEDREQVILHIQDYGPGVKTGDLPFIFDKGFTGGKARATGMGLHLAKRLAADLNIELEATQPKHAGLQLSLKFPKISKPSKMEAAKQGGVQE